jgi:hypothetical protein
MTQNANITHHPLYNQRRIVSSIASSLVFFSVYIDLFDVTLQSNRVKVISFERLIQTYERHHSNEEDFSSVLKGETTRLPTHQNLLFSSKVDIIWDAFLLCVAFIINVLLLIGIIKQLFLFGWIDKSFISVNVIQLALISLLGSK